MKNNLRRWSAALAGAVAVLALGSCAYDPYYGASGSYTTGYGEGYGYGNSSFSTTMFISTGNSRWGYDPYCHSYYDYTRRCYYDPYLYGYYPVGYRPAMVVGVPHPHGYSRSYCPPPSRIHSHTLTNYHNREQAYRSSGHSWSSQVRQQPNRSYRAGHGDSYRGGSYSQPQYQQQQNPGYRGSYNRGYNPQPAGSPYRNSGRSAPSSYNAPVHMDNQPQPNQGGRRYREQSNPSPQYQPGSQPRHERPLQQPQQQPQPQPQPSHERPSPPPEPAAAPSPQPQPQPQPQPAQTPQERHREELRGLGEGRGA